MSDHMIKTSTARTLGLLGLCFPTLVGCLPEDDLSDLTIEAPSPSISLPLLNTNLSVTDIITVKEGGRLTENEDHTYSVLYNSERKSDPVGDFFPKIPAQSYEKGFSLGINSPAFQLKSPAQKFQGDMSLDLAELNIFALESKQGFLDLTLTSDYQHDLEVQITFSNIRLKEDGSPFVWTPNVINGWSNRVSTVRKNLSDYRIELVDGKVSYELEVTIDGSGKPISEDEVLTLGINMGDIEFAYLAGSFTEIDVPLPADTLDIPVLASAVNGTVSLNPTIRMDFSSSFGVPVASDFSSVFIKQKSGKRVQLQDEGDQTFFSGNYEFPYVTQRNDSSATAQQLISRSTSNIEEAFAELPYGLLYDLGFTLNSAQEDTSFITDRSQIAAKVAVELPLEGSFDLVLQDSIPVDFQALEDVEELRLLIKTENSFPIQARLQVYFLDENGQRILNADGQPISLFGDEDEFLKAAELLDSTTGKTRPAAIDLPLVATIGYDDFQQVREATHLLVRTDLESISDEANQIKLYSFYNIRFSLATQIKTSLKR